MKNKQLSTIPKILVGVNLIGEQQYAVFRRLCRLVTLFIVPIQASAQTEPLPTISSSSDLFTTQIAIVISSATAAIVAIMAIRSNRVTQRRILTLNALHEARRDPVLTESMKILSQLDSNAGIDIKSYAIKGNGPSIQKLINDKAYGTLHPK